MSEPDWLGPATDALKDKCLHDAADLLAQAPAQADLLERAMATIEDYIAKGPIRLWAVCDPMITVVAAHRGESPEATRDRLTPPEDLDDAAWQARLESELARPQFGSPTAGVNCGPYRPPESDGFIVADEMRNRVVRAQRREAEAVEAFLREYFLDGRAGVGTHEHVVYPMGADGRRLHAIVPKAEAPSGDRLLPPDEAIARYPTRLI